MLVPGRRRRLPRQKGRGGDQVRSRSGDAETERTRQTTKVGRDRRKTKSRKGYRDSHQIGTINSVKHPVCHPRFHPLLKPSGERRWRFSHRSPYITYLPIALRSALGNSVVPYLGSTTKANPSKDGDAKPRSYHVLTHAC